MNESGDDGSLPISKDGPAIPNTTLHTSEDGSFLKVSSAPGGGTRIEALV